MDWTIRPATRDDRAVLARIMRAALDGLGFVPASHTTGEDQAFLAGLFLSAEVWVAVTDRPIGFVAVTGDVVPALYVVPDYQRQGVGKALIGSAGQGRSGLQLHCFQANSGARAFYAALGFREIARDDVGHNDEGLPDVTLRWENADLWAQGAAWMEGKIIPIAQAKIPVTDWGLTRSDITYDVASVWDGAFFRLDDYVDRFMESLAATRLDPGLTDEQIKAACHGIVARTGLRASYVAMVCSRGKPKVHGNRDPRTCANHFFAWAVPYVNVVEPEIAEQGATVWIAKNVRRIPEDSVNPLAKNYHWGDITAGLLEAKDQDYETVVLLDHAGNVTEGPGFNAFAVKDDRVITSDHGVLHGITRRTVLEMARDAGFKTECRALPLAEFLEADEIFLSTTGGGVVPVVKVDDRVFSNGAPGPVSGRMREMYHDWRMQPRFRQPVDYLS